MQQALAPRRDLAYKTVQTMLNVLVRKRKATRVLKERAYLYRPVLGRSEAVRLALKDMVDRLFGGSAESLVMSLVETHHLTPEKLAELQAALASRKGDGDAHD